MRDASKPLKDEESRKGKNSNPPGAETLKNSRALKDIARPRMGGKKERFSTGRVTFESATSKPKRKERIATKKIERMGTLPEDTSRERGVCQEKRRLESTPDTLVHRPAFAQDETDRRPKKQRGRADNNQAMAVSQRKSLARCRLWERERKDS